MITGLFGKTDYLKYVLLFEFLLNIDGYSCPKGHIFGFSLDILEKFSWYTYPGKWLTLPKTHLWLRRYKESSTIQKVDGLIPGSSSPPAEVSLGKTLKPKLPLMGVSAP